MIIISFQKFVDIAMASSLLFNKSHRARDTIVLGNICDTLDFISKLLGKPLVYETFQTTEISDKFIDIYLMVSLSYMLDNDISLSTSLSEKNYI
jgi:hypothetical protein